MVKLSFFKAIDRGVGKHRLKCLPWPKYGVKVQVIKAKRIRLNAGLVSKEADLYRVSFHTMPGQNDVLSRLRAELHSLGLEFSLHRQIDGYVAQLADNMQYTDLGLEVAATKEADWGEVRFY